MKASVILDYLISNSSGNTFYFDERCCSVDLVKEAILRGFQVRNSYDTDPFRDEFGEWVFYSDLQNMNENKFIPSSISPIDGSGVSRSYGDGFGNQGFFTPDNNGDGLQDNSGRGHSEEITSYPQVSKPLPLLK